MEGGRRGKANQGCIVQGAANDPLHERPGFVPRAAFGGDATAGRLQFAQEVRGGQAVSIEDCTSLTQELVFSVSRCTRQGEVTHATLPNVPARNCGAVGREAMIVQLGKDHVPVRGKCGEFGPRITDTGGSRIGGRSFKPLP